MLHLLGSYWDWAGGNVGAMPLEAVVAGLAGLLFRSRLARVARWMRRRLLAELHERMDEVHATAQAAHQIAASTHKHVTGEDHPAAPREGT